MMRLIALLFALPAFGSVAAPDLELVLTVPAETDLGVEGVRDPVTVWVEMISRAQKRIDLGQMYVSGGEPLGKVIDALEAAGKRGVKVRMLTEEKMLRASDEATMTRLKKIPGMDFRTVPFAKLGGNGIIHAKYMVIDGREAFVGSQNFDWRSLSQIHETGVRTSHKNIVSQIQGIFDFDWKALGLKKGAKAKHGAPAKPGKNPFYLVASPPEFLPPGVVPSEQELPRLIGDAKKEVQVMVMDYYPLAHGGKGFYPTIDNALRAAAARGVKVKLLVSHWSTGKPGVDHLKSLSVLPNVEVRIVTLPEASTGFIPFARVTHSKTMVIDGAVAWVGTSNWTGGYLDESRNLEIVMKDEGLARKVKEIQDKTWNATFTAPIEVAKDYPKPKKG